MRTAALLFGIGACMAMPAQVIEFESGGLKYLTQTRNGVTVMFAHLPVHVREYAVIQVAISNGSQETWQVKPEDFRFLREDGGTVRAEGARSVVTGFVNRGGRDDVVKLVSAYEMGLYGMNRVHAANGYEARRQAAIAEVSSPRLKAAAAAAAIVMPTIRLKPGESTDGAVFYPNAGRPLGTGKVVFHAADTVFEFDTVPVAGSNVR